MLHLIINAACHSAGSILASLSMFSGESKLKKPSFIIRDGGEIAWHVSLSGVSPETILKTILNTAGTDRAGYTGKYYNSKQSWEGISCISQWY